MQPTNSTIDIAKVISDADKLISKINTYLEEMERKYNIDKPKAPIPQETNAA